MLVQGLLQVVLLDGAVLSAKYFLQQLVLLLVETLQLLSRASQRLDLPGQRGLLLLEV